jgi:hypothetical protein
MDPESRNMADAKIIHAPNGLRKAKIGTGRAKLDMKILAKAEKVVEKIQEEYSDWAHEDLAALDDVLKALKSGDDEQQTALKTLYTLSLDMKGQGGSFGFRMMSEVAARLNDFVAMRGTLSKLDIEVVEAHISALTAIYRENVRDDGGTMGTALLIGLDKIVAKANARGRK